MNQLTGHLADIARWATGVCDETSLEAIERDCETIHDQILDGCEPPDWTRYPVAHHLYSLWERTREPIKS